MKFMISKNVIYILKNLQIIAGMYSKNCKINVKLHSKKIKNIFLRVCKKNKQIQEEYEKKKEETQVNKKIL